MHLHPAHGSRRWRYRPVREDDAPPSHPAHGSRQWRYRSVREDDAPPLSSSVDEEKKERSRPPPPVPDYLLRSVMDFLGPRDHTRMQRVSKKARVFSAQALSRRRKARQNARMKRRADARSRYNQYVNARTKACAMCPDDEPVVFLPLAIRQRKEKWCPLPCGENAECCVLPEDTSYETLDSLSYEALLDLHEHHPEYDTVSMVLARGIEDKHMPTRVRHISMFTTDDISDLVQTLIDLQSVEDFVQDIVVDEMYPDMFKYTLYCARDVGLLLHTALRRDPWPLEDALVELLRLLRREREAQSERMKKARSALTALLRLSLPEKKKNEEFIHHVNVFVENTGVDPADVLTGLANNKLVYLSSVVGEDMDHLYENVWIHGITSGLRAVAEAYPDVPVFQAASRLWDDIARRPSDG